MSKHQHRMELQTPLAPVDRVRHYAASTLDGVTSSYCPARRAHILFIIDQLLNIGGAEKVLLNMIRLLPKDRFRISLATFKLSQQLNLENELNCPIYVLPMERTYDWNALRAGVKLRRIIRSEGVDIVHTFHESSDIWGGMVAKLSGCPILISSQRDMGFLRSPKHQFAYRFVRKMADRVLAVSEDVRQFCIRQDELDPDKVVTIYNGLELQGIAPGPDNGVLRELGIDDAAPVVVTVANVRKIKGIDVFVEAAAIVCKEFPNARFVVAGGIGEQEHFDALRQRIDELKIENNVLFTGAISNVYRLLKAGSVFCLLSRSEGFSNALIEAMACNLPCVATPVGGNKEAIRDRESGYIVPVEDPNAAAERILFLLKNPGEGLLMGKNARETVESNFTSEAMIRKLTDIYLELQREKGCGDA